MATNISKKSLREELEEYHTDISDFIGNDVKCVEMELGSVLQKLSKLVDTALPAINEESVEEKAKRLIEERMKLLSISLPSNTPDHQVRHLSKQEAREKRAELFSGNGISLGRKDIEDVFHSWKSSENFDKSLGCDENDLFFDTILGFVDDSGTETFLDQVSSIARYMLDEDYLQLSNSFNQVDFQVNSRLNSPSSRLKSPSPSSSKRPRVPLKSPQVVEKYTRSQSPKVSPIALNDQESALASRQGNDHQESSKPVKTEFESIMQSWKKADQVSNFGISSDNSSNIKSLKKHINQPSEQEITTVEKGGQEQPTKLDESGHDTPAVSELSVSQIKQKLQDSFQSQVKPTSHPEIIHSKDSDTAQSAGCVVSENNPKITSSFNLPQEQQDSESSSGDPFEEDSELINDSLEIIESDSEDENIFGEIENYPHLIVARVLFDYTPEQNNGSFCMEKGNLCSIILPTQDTSIFEGKYKISENSREFNIDDDWVYASLERSSQSTDRSGWVPRNHLEIIFDSNNTESVKVYECAESCDPDNTACIPVTQGSVLVELEEFKDDSKCLILDTMRDSREAKCYIGDIGLCSKHLLNKISSEEGLLVEDGNPFALAEDSDEDPFEEIEEEDGIFVPIDDKESTVYAGLSFSRKSSLTPQITTVTALSSGVSRTENRRESFSHLMTDAKNIANEDIENIGPQSNRWSNNFGSAFLEGFSEDEVKRQEAIFELVWTEKTYLLNLQMMHEVFIEPLSTMSIMSKNDVINIFGNINKIFWFNLSFFKAMIALISSDLYSIENIGDLLLEYSAQSTQEGYSNGFGVYFEYCSSQDSASSILQNLRAKNAQLSGFLKSACFNPKCKNLDLSSYLLEPMQRITRYPLLIRQILKFTPKNSQEYSKVAKALRSMEDLLLKVNEAVNQAKIDKISQLVDFGEFKISLSQPTKNLGPRRFMFEGDLWKVKGRRLRGFLFNDMLLLCQSTKDGRYVIYRQPFFLKHISVRDWDSLALRNLKYLNASSEIAFQIIHKDKILAVKAKDKSSKKLWMKKLNDARTVKSKSTSNLKS